MREVIRYMVLVCAILGAGCATVREMAHAQKPLVSVAQARIAGLSFETIDLAIDLKVTNPNTFSLPLAALDYALSLSGRSVLSGSQPQSISIPANGQRIVTLPLSLRFRDLFASIGSLSSRDEAPYGVSCGLSFDVPLLGRTRIPIHHEGSLPLVRMPGISLGGLRVRDLSMTGATMDISLGIDNPNGFDISMKRIEYSLAINGASWAMGQSHRSDVIPRKGRSELRIPVALDFLAIGSGVYDLLRGSSQVSYALSGALDVGTSLPLLNAATLPLNESGTIRISR